MRMIAGSAARRRVARVCHASQSLSSLGTVGNKSQNWNRTVSTAVSARLRLWHLSFSVSGGATTVTLFLRSNRLGGLFTTTSLSTFEAQTDGTVRVVGILSCTWLHATSRSVKMRAKMCPDLTTARPHQRSHTNATLLNLT